MKLFTVYTYFPASELETQIRAENLEDAVRIAQERKANTYLAKDVTWFDSTGEKVRVTSVAERYRLQ